MVQCPRCWEKKKTSRTMDCIGLTPSGVGYFCHKCRTLVLFKIDKYISVPGDEE